MNKYISILLLASFCLMGCSISKDELLPAGGANMLELWQQQGSSGRTATEARTTLRRELNDQDVQARQTIDEGYSRTAENEIQQVFPRLPNPDMVIYIYPHMVGDESSPVPGYSSVFPFYSRVQYALPGERLEAL